MDNRMNLFAILYALTARDGRGERLFGPFDSLAYEAFGHSLVGDAFPELWFELPLLGDPWLDLHALTSHEGLGPDTVFDAAHCGGCPEAFSWFAAQGPEARQLALSWDTSSGVADRPAVQLLAGTSDPDLTCGFLEAVGREDAIEDYRSFVARLPEDWFACYTGTFPARPGHHLRVECIPERGLQARYAQDPALLEKHLRQVGVQDFGDTLVARCQRMADTPFKLEFQFDVMPGGTAGPTMAASLRFASPSKKSSWQWFDVAGEAGTLMRELEAWGLVDERWQMLSDTAFAKRVTKDGRSWMLYCFMAFIKLRWRCGDPLDAKAYLMAGALGR